MKTQLLIFILYLVTGLLNGKPLDEKENDDRLERCGNFHGQNLGHIISWASNGKTPAKTATLISKRHILVSSKLVLDNKKWIHNNEKLDKNLCRKDTNEHVTVPEEATKSLKFGWSLCNSKLDKCTNDFKITRAVIICNKRTLAHAAFPMIMETSIDFTYSTFCLAREGYNFGLSGNFYGYRNNESTRLTITVKDNSDYFKTEQFTSDTDGLLFDDQETLIGLSVDGDGSAPLFLDVRRFSRDICDLFRICQHSRSLTYYENFARRENCGTKPFSEKHFNVGWVQNGLMSTVVLISPRHVLTSAELVLSAAGNDTIWNYNKEEFERHECNSKKNVHIRVPPEAFKTFQFGWGLVDISRGFIICNSYTMKFVNRYYLPLLLEVNLPKGFDSMTPFCLSDDKSILIRDDAVSFYHFSTKNTTVTKQDLTVILKSQELISTTSEYTSFENRGGALVHVENEKQVLVGSGASVDQSSNAWFFNIQWIIKDFCYLFAICSKPGLPPAPITVPSPPSPPTEAPTTEEPTTEESTSEKPTSSKAPEKSTKSPESTMAPESSTPEKSHPLETMEPIPVIDLDEEFREFQERQEKEDRGDWDEWGNDFYRSADFFSSGRRSELFVGFLMVVMVVWRMVLR